MIVTGENTKLLPKGADVANDASQGGTSGQASSSEPPPSYQSTQVPPSQPQVHTHDTQYPIVYRESPTRRFWSAFLVATLVWFLCTLLVQSMYNAAHWTHGSWKGSFSVPANIALVECKNVDQWSDALVPTQTVADRALLGQHLAYASSTSFELPLTSKSLLFVSRGSQTYGTVTVATSNLKSDVAKIHVKIMHVDSHFLDSGIKACLVERAKGEIGVGLFTRHWSNASTRLYYETSIILPKAGSNRTSLHIEGLETDVENAVHKLEGLRDSLDFSYISLKSSNAPIYVESISAETAIFQTTNSPITGVFNVSRSLSLETSNAPIDVDVGMHNVKDYVSDLSIRTSSGEIHARASLLYNSDGGRYMVTAVTSNSVLDISFPTSPVDSTLKLLATTSNSPATISLDPAYEGTLSLTDSNYSPIVRRRSVKDPSGKHRKRTVNINNISRNVLKGSVSWSSHERPGTVEVRSSNSPVVVQL